MAVSFPVTRVRYDEAQAASILRHFAFGGQFGTDRPPRGVDSAHLLRFIEHNVPQAGGADVYLKVLHALRFYELGDAVPHLLRTLEQPVVDEGDLERCCYAIQAAADVGLPTPELLSHVCNFFDETLVPHPQAPRVWPVLFETRIVLAPHGSDAAVEARLADEVRGRQAHARDGEAAMMAYDGVSAVQRNDLPRAQRRATDKVALREQSDDDARRHGLVETYLGRRHLGKTIEEWAGRCLRWEAFTRRPEPVWGMLARAIDEIDRSRLSPAQADLELVRAAQAILYLGGRLEPDLRRQYEEAHGVANFLWDDP
jgi:hypothetical protein